MACGPHEYGVCVPRVELVSDSPREDTAGKVVDDGVHVRFRTVEHFDDRYIETPSSFGAWARKPSFGFAGHKRRRGRRHPRSRSRLLHVAGCEDFADALRVQREPSDGHVTMLRGLHHVADRLNLVEGQALYVGTRTARSTVQRASEPMRGSGRTTTAARARQPTAASL